MSDFLITELDDRYEFGIVVIDDDVLRYDNEGSSCKNSGTCCGSNQPGNCTNSNNCSGSACCKGGAEEEDASS